MSCLLNIGPRQLVVVLAFVNLGLIGPARSEANAPTDRPVFNVRTFGARADGTTDDTAAIQTAVDRASEVSGTVRIPAGRYLVGSIELPSHVDIEGDGETSQLLLRAQPLAKTGAESRSPIRPGHMFVPKDMATVASVEGVRIAHLFLRGNSREQNAGGPMPLSGAMHGIAILGGKNWIVSEVRVEDFDGDGIYLGANLVYPGARDIGNGKLGWPNGAAPESRPLAAGNIIEKSVVRGNLRNGMMISHGDRNVLRHNLFERNQAGIVCTPPAGPDRRCTRPDEHPKFAPAVYESAELDLEPNRIKVLNGETVSWERVTNTLIEGNTFRAGPRFAIQIVKGTADISGNRIVHNTFDDNLGGGIVVHAEGARQTTIKDNDFTWSDAAHQPFVVRIHAGDGNKVVGNRFRGPLPTSGRVILLESFSRWRTVRCAVLVDNLVDVPTNANVPLIVLDRAVVDSVVAGNRFPSGGRLEAAPESLIYPDTISRCQTE
ncbi:right-handed parallel beta-helix repeat-containing protein [Bradyrhizobium sp. 4]|uniref:right-handed parallel beta-helix repeat-containing protein n=1 Tax=unclassified Bradyrhizobium TaxID=2631580 RepID=UPI001FF97175|nr:MULTISPECIES: right-handed parallel beta-helix repeat-containing protein [unclassified Bradyrhizobium]MCK1397444.1 right-handed parallel beta-helix repeat-containing protein [Bradyrhizobium sp. 39]MCK1752517.1 right-handed parallel beta-helix repeat-containing protein [Bradyrhizobium sp. 135]UPJ36736.1 right-handed parallel beta-helix repeat-containing protein [Bradyrhizobium sp. 4]